MNNKEILSIIAVSALGLCLLLGLAKMAMKSDKAKKGCDNACSLLVFVAVVLVSVSQLLGENNGYEAPLGCRCEGGTQRGLQESAANSAEERRENPVILTYSAFRTKFTSQLISLTYSPAYLLIPKIACNGISKCGISCSETLVK